MSSIQVVIRLLLATVLGGLIGFEREVRGRIAGFRTHILVCLGSALITLTSIFMYETYSGGSNADPSRIAAQIVTGIGFLGAGTILRSGTTITGLTTAANLWAVAGIGIAVGCGFYIAALTASLLVIVILAVFSKMEDVMKSKVPDRKEAKA